MPRCFLSGSYAQKHEGSTDLDLSTSTLWLFHLLQPDVFLSVEPYSFHLHAKVATQPQEVAEEILLADTNGGRKESKHRLLY